MADALVDTVMIGGPRTYVVHYTNISDGTGLNKEVILDLSALPRLPGTNSVPTKAAIQEIQWNMQGFTDLVVEWDHTTDEVAALLNGNGYKDYSPFGNLVSANSGGTGDVLLTTVGAANGSTFDLTIVFILS